MNSSINDNATLGSPYILDNGGGGGNGLVAGVDALIVVTLGLILNFIMICLFMVGKVSIHLGMKIDINTADDHWEPRRERRRRLFVYIVFFEIVSISIFR